MTGSDDAREAFARLVGAQVAVEGMSATPRTKNQPLAVTWMWSSPTSTRPPSASGVSASSSAAKYCFMKIDQVRELDRFELDAALAHQRHDDGAAHQVVAVSASPRTIGKLAGAHGVVVLVQVLAFWL